MALSITSLDKGTALVVNQVGSLCYAIYHSINPSEPVGFSSTLVSTGASADTSTLFGNYTVAICDRSRATVFCSRPSNYKTLKWIQLHGASVTFDGSSTIHIDGSALVTRFTGNLVVTYSEHSDLTSWSDVHYRNVSPLGFATSQSTIGDNKTNDRKNLLSSGRGTNGKGPRANSNSNGPERVEVKISKSKATDPAKKRKGKDSVQPQKPKGNSTKTGVQIRNSSGRAKKSGKEVAAPIVPEAGPSDSSKRAAEARKAKANDAPPTNVLPPLPNGSEPNPFSTNPPVATSEQVTPAGSKPASDSGS